MEEVKHRRWLRIFFAIAVLLLAQVTWWAMVFVKDVRLIAALRGVNLELSSPDRGPEFEAELQHIERDSFRHQVMFLSETTFFALMACVALYLLYRALKVEERSREIQRNFIEVVTHESKTPLTALKLRLESAAGKEGASKELGLALEEVRRLSSIFEKALNLNRVERAAFRFELVALADIVRAVAHRLEPLARSHDVTLRLELDPEATVQGDPDGLRGAVQGLMENAILYCRNETETPEVRVEVRVAGGRVVLSVADNGPGIAPEDRPHVFERFYRGQNGNLVPGTGLGLYIARSVVEAHQGVLRLADGASGARFEIELPESRMGVA